MRFGGSTQFGLGQYGGDPFGLTVGYVITRILEKLARFQRVGATGSVQTIKRLTAPLGDTAARDMIMASGTPAMLVASNGSTYQSGGSNASRFVDRASIVVICIASSYRSRLHRLQGRNVYDIGLDNLTKWALTYTGRALVEMSELGDYRPINTRLGTFDAERFISITEWQVGLNFDTFDDVSATGILEELGIVHSPSDYSQLFSADNLTPNTTDPTSPAVGVASLLD